MKLVESSAKEFYDKYKNEIKYASYFEHLMDVYNDEREDVKFYTCEKTTANSFYYFVAKYSDEENEDALIINGNHEFWENEDFNEIISALNDLGIHKRIYLIAHCYCSFLREDYGFDYYATNRQDEKLVAADVEDVFTGKIIPEVLEGYNEDYYYSIENIEIEGTQREIIRDKYPTYVYYKDI